MKSYFRWSMFIKSIICYSKIEIHLIIRTHKKKKKRTHNTSSYHKSDISFLRIFVKLIKVSKTEDNYLLSWKLYFTKCILNKYQG